MHITCRNPNDAFPLTMKMLRTDGVRLPAPRSDVPAPTCVEFPEPVTVTFTNPRERVLFHSKRRINPFLHFFEPLWILAGRNDVRFMTAVLKSFDRFSDDGETYHGAYGWRVRRAEDQVAEAIRRLKENRADRQVVLQIREPADMWYRGKDMPCNTSVALKIRDDALNMHVFNRSNDAIWGGPAGGTNHPQFTTLLEYVAMHVGVSVGKYIVTTDSMHAYDNSQWQLLKDTGNEADPYATFYPHPLLFGDEGQARLFDVDLDIFFDRFDHDAPLDPSDFCTCYFRDVVFPMWGCLLLHKDRKRELAYRATERIAAHDWKLVTEQFLYEKLDAVPA